MNGILGALRTFDQRLTMWTRRRPGRTARLFALAIFLFSLYGLTHAEDWRDYIEGGTWCLWTALFAVAPRGLYDGRFAAWANLRKAPSTLLVLVFLLPTAFTSVTAFADDWKFGLFITVWVALALTITQLAKRRA
jgi:hypothetical protein